MKRDESRSHEKKNESIHHEINESTWHEKREERQTWNHYVAQCMEKMRMIWIDSLPYETQQKNSVFIVEIALLLFMTQYIKERKALRI